MYSTVLSTSVNTALSKCQFYYYYFNEHDFPFFRDELIFANPGPGVIPFLAGCNVKECSAD